MTFVWVIFAQGFWPRTQEKTVSKRNAMISNPLEIFGLIFDTTIFKTNIQNVLNF